MAEIKAPVRQEDIDRYERSWAQEMATYWRERMLRLGVYDTGRLYQSITGTVKRGANTSIEHNFFKYGIYVAAGVGGDYGKRDDGTIKKNFETGKPRQKRDWFSKKYYSSVMKLNEFEAAFYGMAYQGLMATALQDIAKGIGPAGNL